MPPIRAVAATEPGGTLHSFEYDPGPLGRDLVEIEVHSCGLCHSDLSMLDDEWGISSYPFVPGHEVVGVVAAVGDAVTTLAPGQRVGLGWFSSSCNVCRTCLGGDQNLCPRVEPTIVGRFGGAADRVRCNHAWAVPIPERLDSADAGPLLCAGVAVFNPIVQADVRPTHRVGVVGIGGLGHLAVQFLHRWGCEVTAFTSSSSKAEVARSLGAHRIVDSRSEAALDDVAGRFDFILATSSRALDWARYVAALAPRGRLHNVGLMMDPIAVRAIDLVPTQRSLSGSPPGSPATVIDMLEFCARHGIAPITEHVPMSRINEAMERLRAGTARYRIVLDRD